MIGRALDKRPAIVAITGPNGAGKTTFFHSHLREAGLRFVNADDIARELDISPYDAAKLTDALRRELVRLRESFVFETVFSDPVGDKLAFLTNATAAGYNVVLCFIGISGPETPRTLANLNVAIQTLPAVLVFDNEDLAAPFRKVTEFQSGKAVFVAERVPQWLRALL